MNMNFFKKVITFFSILWNAILWRKTVKDKKSKSSEKGTKAKTAPSETQQLTQDEEAEKAFVDVPLNTFADEEANHFQSDSEINLRDPIIIREGELGLTSPIVAQSLDFVQDADDSHLADTTQVDILVEKRQGVLVDDCKQDGQLADVGSLPPAEGCDLSEKDDWSVEEEMSILIELEIGLDDALHNNPADEKAYQFRIDSENNSHDSMIVQDVPEPSLPTVVQPPNFGQVVNDSPIPDTTRVEVLYEKHQDDLVGDCEQDGQLLNVRSLPPADGFVISEKDDFPIDKETNALIEGETAFDDSPLKTPADEKDNGLLMNMENELHDPVIAQDALKLSSTIAAQYLNTEFDADLPSADITQVEKVGRIEVMVEKQQNELVDGCGEDEQLMNITSLPPPERCVSSEKDSSDVDFIINGEEAFDGGPLTTQDDEEDQEKDQFRRDSETNLNAPATIEDVFEDPSSTIARCRSFTQVDEDLPLEETTQVLEVLVEKTQNAVADRYERDELLNAESSPPPEGFILEKGDEDSNATIECEYAGHLRCRNIPEVEAVIIQPGSSDLLEEPKDELQKDFVKDSLDVIILQNEEVNAINTEEFLEKLQSPPKISENEHENHPTDAPVQSSVSSVELSEITNRCQSELSEPLAVDYSTNYMVRSDSMVNFLPNAHFLEKLAAAPIILSTADMNDDSVRIETKVSAASEPNCIEETSAAVSQPVDQSCMEEIMCTSTGILKLSDSYGIEKQSNSLDAVSSSIVPLDTTPEDETPDEKEEESPSSPRDDSLPGVFRNDDGRSVSDLGTISAGVVGREVRNGMVAQSDPVNVQPKTLKFDYKGKELGHKVQPKDESNEHSSTKSENDTLENIDELSFDVNNINTQGENAFQDNGNASNREELEMDPVVVLRHISAQRHDESGGTGSNGNILSILGSEIHLPGSGGANSSNHSDGNIRSNVNPRLQDDVQIREFQNSLQISNDVALDVPSYNFSGQYIPHMMPSDYNAGDIAIRTESSFVVNDLEDSIPIVSGGLTNYCKWEHPIACTVPDDGSTINFDTRGLRFTSKHENLFYTHMGAEDESLSDGSGNYVTKSSNELYPFIDGASYVFGIPEEVRKEEHFNPCVGAAPGRSNPGKTSENLNRGALKLEGFKFDEPNNITGKSDQSWVTAQHPLQHDLFPIDEVIEPKFPDGCYLSGMKLPVESELLQKNIPQSCSIWSVPDQPGVENTSPFHNGYETNDHYPHALDNVHTQPVDFVPMDYLPSPVYDNNQSAICNTANVYDFVSPYGVGVLPMLNIPFCVQDPSFVARGPVPPFVFPIGSVDVEQDEGPPVESEPDAQGSLYPITPHPYWVGFQNVDSKTRTQNDISMKSEMTTTIELHRNYQPEICLHEAMDEEDDATDECPIPDPYFQLAENSSLHSVKSKADSYNGSLFCESLRSILSSHNAESDHVIPSFSCSSVRCYNPSLVVRSCETSLSNDSLPSIIVEGSYTKSVDENYSVKEKFMNDVNTALNESMIDQMQVHVDEFPAGFLERGDFEIEMLGTAADSFPGDIEQTLRGTEAKDTSELDEFTEEYTNQQVLAEGMLEGHDLGLVNQVVDNWDTVVNVSNVNELLTEILESVIDIATKNEDGCTLETSRSNDDDSEAAEENIVVQHMIHFEESVVNDDEVANFVVYDSIEDEDLAFKRNELQCIDSKAVVENSILGHEVLEVSSEVVIGGLENVDSCENRGDVNVAHEYSEVITWSLEEKDHLATTRVKREERELVCEEDKELVRDIEGMSSTEPSKRKRRRNRRRKEDTVEVTGEPESVMTAEIGIGDGSTQPELKEERYEKEEGILQEVLHFEHSTAPEATQGPAEEAKTTGDDDQSKEDQNGDHDEHDRQLGNSSNNRKRRNKKKKRKN